ncbi:MAG TPA: hypothetical protein VN541_20615 [Tepidisphaeraceae bacterium]|nr:hypothetical protein [Tepidisphaeraceae bacterium]
MAKTGKKHRRGRKKGVVERYLRPLPEREAHNDFRSAGMAMRVVPVVDRLHEAGVLNDNEYRALSYYRDQASLADRSPVRSCCDFSVRGGGGPGVAITSALIETGRLERGMGPLWRLCRAVCVDDVELSKWCESQHGEQAMAARGAHLLGMAALELKYAAGGIVMNCA